MSDNQKLICCNKEIKDGELWLLKDLKDFSARKLYIGKCKNCGETALLLIEKRISDNRIFINNITGIEAVKTLYREKKRKLIAIPYIKRDNLFGWIYGINSEIKNKKGEVIQIKQYSCDLITGEKRFEKVINLKD